MKIFFLVPSVVVNNFIGFKSLLLHTWNRCVLLKYTPSGWGLLLKESFVVFAAEKILTRIELRVEVDEQYTLAKVIELPCKVHSESRFSDAAFHVE